MDFENVAPMRMSFIGFDCQLIAFTIKIHDVMQDICEVFNNNF